MLVLRAGEDVTLHLLQPANAESLFELQERNRARLLRWMPFSNAMALEDVRNFIQSGLDRFTSGRGVSAGVWWQGHLAGWAGMRIHEDGYGTIGYWLDASHEGKGIATRSVLALVSYGFDTLKLPRLEIRCDPSNIRSSAV